MRYENTGMDERTFPQVPKKLRLCRFIQRGGRLVQKQNRRPAQQRARILRRNGPVLLRRFESEWIPLEKRYFEAYHKTRQDLLILSGATAPEDEPNGEENLP